MLRTELVTANLRLTGRSAPTRTCRTVCAGRGTTDHRGHPAIVAAIRAATGLPLSRVPVRPEHLTGT